MIIIVIIVIIVLSILFNKKEKFTNYICIPVKEKYNKYTQPLTYNSLRSTRNMIYDIRGDPLNPNF